MTIRPQLSIRLPHSWCIAGANPIVRVASAAETLGFWGVSVQDHLLSDNQVSPCASEHDGDDRNVFESLQTLAFVAARSEHIRLISAVIVLPFRNPILLAKQLATLDVLSNGRTVVGVGIGASRKARIDERQHLASHRGIAEREFDLLGVEGNRGQIATEYIEALKVLWTEDAPSYTGRHVAFNHTDLYPKPIQTPHPPIWVGGRSTHAHKRAALNADGWFPSQETVTAYADGHGKITAIATANERPEPAGWGINLFVSINKDGEVARMHMNKALGHRFRSAEALLSSTIAGSPAEVVDRIRAYASAGVRMIDVKILPLTLKDTLEQMEILAYDIMPEL